MPHPTIEQLMIQNLQKQNDALQKRCQTLEELLDTKEALILNQNKLIKLICTQNPGHIDYCLGSTHGCYPIFNGRHPFFFEFFCYCSILCILQ